MIVGEDFRYLFLDLLPQITYFIVSGDFNPEMISNGLELVVNEKKPYF
jgi:hypothetical protein